MVFDKFLAATSGFRSSSEIFLKTNTHIAASIFIFVLAAIWIYYIGGFDRGANDVVGINELIKQVRAIPAPSKTEEVGDMYVDSKSYSSLVEQKYESYLYASDILSHYRSWMLANGWRLANIRPASYSGLIFCRNRVEFSLQVLADNEGGVKYSVSLTSSMVSVKNCKRN